MNLPPATPHLHPHLYPVFDSASLPFVEAQFAKYQANPASVDAAWQAYFAGWLAAGGAATAGAAAAGGAGLAEHLFMQAWREDGHRAAHLNPLETAPATPDFLQPAAFGLTEAELTEQARAVRAAYGGTTGIECAAVAAPKRRAWVQAWWENPANRNLSNEARIAALKAVVEANALEQFLHKKFVGAKRFSGEGCDVLLALLHAAAQACVQGGTRHLVLGMAHRGRLNVLCNVFHKPFAELFAAFADKLTTTGGPTAGDVKYHLGKDYTLRGATGGEVNLHLLFNPSHLEAVNAVVLGQARAYADAGEKTLPILVHGDSAVAGQGAVAEAYNLAGLPAYTVGGTLHIITNNQVGFTANAGDAFSGAYCTDGFKQTGGPIVHVNADDVDACLVALNFALAYRQEFAQDVMLDVVGYRRWGHNEGDDPTFTQPQLYEKIRSHPPVAELYAKQLVQAGVLNQATVEKLEQDYLATLNAAFSEAHNGLTVKGKTSAGLLPDAAPPSTLVAAKSLEKIAAAWGNIPRGFTPNAKVQKVLEERAGMLRGEKPLNWGAAETAAYAALLQEGTSVRLTGQDVQRGTFSHRHAVLTCQATGTPWSPLAALAAKGATFSIYNSALSEYAVMGFEYGYGLGNPTALTIWEAQFGDFANGAQIVIDQFLAAANTKWGQANGLVLLLPHGYEGQGPEHSSARLERFLQLAAENNLSICMPSTPASMFHLLRRQARRSFKQPLVVMTPKSGLRNTLAVSPVSELTTGAFSSVLADSVNPKNVKKVVVCGGKIYYDLLAKRQETGADHVALLRVEELYPWPAAQLAEALKPYKTKDVVWAQEEPRNMGAWWYVRENWDTHTLGYVHYVGRPAAASPAAGTGAQHAREQAEIIEAIFGSAKAKQAA